MSTKEVVTIVGGGLGARISDGIWKLFYQEYGIDPRCYSSNVQKNIKIPDLPVETFFEVTETKVMPRAIVLTTEMCLEFMQRHKQDAFNPQFYHPDSIISLKDNNLDSFFTQTYENISQDALEKSLDRIRLMCEKCSNLQGFVICRAHYDAIGSGATSRLLDELTDYKKKTKIDFALTTPYPLFYETRMPILNTFFTMNHCVENIDCCFISDVKATIYDISERMNVKNSEFLLSNIKAQAFSNITSPMRYDWRYNYSLDNYKILVPHKDVPFVAMSYAPLASPEMLAYDPRKGAYISSLFFYRGSEVTNKDIWNELSGLNARCKEGKDIRCANGIEKPFQAKSVRAETTTLIGGCIGRSRQSVVNCSNNTALYHYWQEFALFLKETLKAETPGRERTVYEKLETRLGKDKLIEDLNRVNECLLNVLSKYAEFDSEIKHDRSTAGFLPLV